MTEYDNTVERQRQLIAAEEWAKGVSGIHVHGISSMWYDDHPEDTRDDKRVSDYSFFSGLIKRYQGGKLLRTFGEELTGDNLIAKYGSYVHDAN